MPLLSGRKTSTVFKNLATLMNEKPGKSRAKGIATLARRRGISLAEAKKTQSLAIAFSKAKIKRKKA